MGGVSGLPPPPPQTPSSMQVWMMGGRGMDVWSSLIMQGQTFCLHFYYLFRFSLLLWHLDLFFNGFRLCGRPEKLPQLCFFKVPSLFLNKPEKRTATTKLSTNLVGAFLAEVREL